MWDVLTTSPRPAVSNQKSLYPPGFEPSSGTSGTLIYAAAASAAALPAIMESLRS